MFEQYVTDLTHVDPGVRYEAAQKLGASNDTRAVEPLIRALPDNNAKVQYAAVSGLIKLGAAQAAPAILDLLLDQRECQVWALMKLNIGMRLRAGLIEMVQPGDYRLAERVSDALDDPTFAEHQQALLVRMLGKTGAPEQTDRLIDLLLKGSDMLRVAAAEALGWSRNPRAVAPLLVAINESDSAVRETAAEALGRIGDARAFDRLLEALDDSSEWVRRAAAVSLGDLGDRRAVERLTAALQDESELVQDAAFEALKKLSYDHFTTVL